MTQNNFLSFAIFTAHPRLLHLHQTPTPSNKPSPPPQYPIATHQARTPPIRTGTQTQHIYKCTHVHTLWLVAIKNDGWWCVSGDLPLSSSGAREELQCDVTADDGLAGWWIIFTCVWFWACGWVGGAGGIQFGGWVDPVGLAASLNQGNEWEPTLGVTPFLSRWPLLISLFSLFSF